MKKSGTKEEVWAGLAEHTKGGLTKKDLIEVKKGETRRIVSRAKHEAGVKNFHKTLGGARAQHARAVRGHAMLGGYLL